jgi:hypothetical protein
MIKSADPPALGEPPLPDLNDEWLQHPPHDLLEQSARRDAVREIIARQKRSRRTFAISLLLLVPVVLPAIAFLGRVIH